MDRVQKLLDDLRSYALDAQDDLDSIGSTPVDRLGKGLDTIARDIARVIKTVDEIKFVLPASTALEAAE